MKIDPRHEWQRLVRQAQSNIDANDPHIDDVVIIRMNAYVNMLELKLCEHSYKMDIAMSRKLTLPEKSEIVTIQLANETFENTKE